MIWRNILAFSYVSMNLFKFEYNFKAEIIKMEFLPDPINDRPMKDLPPFVNKALADTTLFIKNDQG